MSSSGAGELREALASFAQEHAPELVEEARREALADAKALLVAQMTQALLSASGRALDHSPAPPAMDDEADHAGAGEAGPPAAAVKLAHYVYGVVPGDTEIPSQAGIDPRYEVFLLEDQGLAALVSRVSLSEFGEGPLHEHLNDVGWLEEKARAHEHVLDMALERTTVVPLRLCTIYEGEEQVRAMLAEERAVLQDALERLDGKAEWGVKAVARPGALAEAAAARPETNDAPGLDASPGTAYMHRRQREARSRATADEIAAEWAAALHDSFAGLATESLSNPPQSAEVSGHDGEMLLNGAYLLPNGAAAELRALAERLAEDYRPHGVSVELTGPWPPFNFVAAPVESAR